MEKAFSRKNERTQMKPNLLHIISTDAGGAGKAAMGVYTKLEKQGYPSEFIVLDKFRENEEIKSVSNTSKLIRKIKRVLFKNRKDKNNNYQFYGIDEKHTYVSSRSIYKLIEKKPDFIFVYWISGFLNARNLYDLSRKYNATIVLSMTDMVSFTGGCHFSLGCLNYETGCGSCPGLDSTRKNDETKMVVNFKQKFYDKMKLAVVVGTEALKDQVEKSYLLGSKYISLIRYHIDIDQFQNFETKSLRERYNIPINKKILFCGSTHIHQERKGFGYLKKALDELYISLNEKAREDVAILVAGNGSEDLKHYFSFDVINLGYLETEQKLAEAYGLSDVYLNTSIDDIGPFMLVEAMLSKRLVVSYNVGLGIDLIKHEKTGFLANNRDYKQYADCIEKAIKCEGEEKQSILESAYLIAKDSYEWKKQPRQYEQLFLDLN